jgi:CRP-like cAMP-binding protein
MERNALWGMAQELRDVLPLHVLDGVEGQTLFSHLRLRRFAANEVVYHRGDPAADTFVVHQGMVKSMLQNEQGHELVLKRYGRGEFFGTLALFRDGHRESTVSALVATTVLQIGRAGAQHVLARNPRATSFMFERMAETIEQLACQVEAIVFLDVRGRLARHLLELRRRGEATLRQEELAAAIGANVFTVNKTLADFGRRRLVRIERRCVHVLDEAQLREEIRA